MAPISGLTLAVFFPYVLRLKCKKKYPAYFSGDKLNSLQNEKNEIFFIFFKKNKEIYLQNITSLK